MNSKKDLIIFCLLFIVIGLLLREEAVYVWNRYLRYRIIELPPQRFTRNLLLISNSRQYELGREDYFQHCRSNIIKFLEPFRVTEVLLIPYAGANVAHLGVPANNSEYADIVRAEIFNSLNIRVRSIADLGTRHEKRDAVAVAQCIFMAGGNAFKLLEELESDSLVHPIKMAVGRGTPYIGVSSGVVVANPTLHTSRSLPIRNLVSYKALCLIPFYVNVHFYHSLGSRLNQFLRENEQEQILAIPTGMVVHVVGNRGELVGFGTAELIRNRHGKFTRTYIDAGSDISFLL